MRMKTHLLFSRLLLIVAASLMAMTTMAQNQFYIYIPTLTTSDLGTEITVPVRAEFMEPVSTWEVQLFFPVGLTPVSCSAGCDMTFSASDWDMEHDQRFNLVHNEDFTRFASSTYGMRAVYYDEEGAFNPSNPLKWQGYYSEMFFITLRIDDYIDGYISIISKTTSNEASLEPIQVGGNGFIIESDVDWDGCVTISDITYLMNVIVEGYTGYWCDPDNEYMQYQSGDINHDGYIDITDVEQLCDFITLGVWYSGYEIIEDYTSIHVKVNEDIINDNIPPTINFSISDTLSLTSEDLGKDITIPIKASFGGYISSWDVQISLPEGLSPVRIEPGSDMTLNYLDYSGREQSGRAFYAISNDKTHIVAHTYDVGYQPSNGDDEYEEYGSVKWEPGDYDEMLLLTVHVNDDYMQDGEITITSHATCGMDTRNPDMTFWPIVLNPTYSGWLYGDVNNDGAVSIADIITFMYYFVNPEQEEQYFSTECGDPNQDGVVNLLDMEMTYDLLINVTEWMDGYVLSECVSSFPVILAYPEPIPGDIDGDGVLTVSDITTIISLLLNNSSGFYVEEADANDDGVVDIDDVTALINTLLNAH